MRAITREKLFAVKPFCSVKLQEHWREYWHGEKISVKKERKDICTYRDIPVTDREAGVVLRQVHDKVDFEERHCEYSLFEVRLFSFKKDSGTARKITEAECMDRFYADYVEDQVQLWCDAESFFVCVDGREAELSVGTGGFYGRVSLYENSEVFYLDFSIDTDMTEWSELEDAIRTIFQVESESA